MFGVGACSALGDPIFNLFKHRILFTLIINSLNRSADLASDFVVKINTKSKAI